MMLFPFDELSRLEGEIDGLKSPDTDKKKGDADKYIDEVTDLFVMAFVYGTIEASSQLGTSAQPDMAKARAVIEERFDGKDYKDRIREYLSSGTDYDIKRVLETDAHRVYNAGLFDAAEKAGAVLKTWNTMLDDRVRETHEYLEGVTIPIDAEFYSYKGGKTLYPGQWGIAEEDCNCRCWLTFSRG